MATDYVRCRIDPAIKERATKNLEAKGLSMSDALRNFVTLVADEKDDSEDDAAYEAFVAAAVERARNNPHPTYTHDEAYLYMRKRFIELMEKHKALA